MRVARNLTFPEVVSAFLKAEVGSGRIKAEGEIVYEPDLQDALQNHKRLEILGSVRGPIFSGIEGIATWQEVVFSREELERVKYMNWKGWVDLSEGSRLAKVAAERIKAGFRESPYVEKILAIRDAIQSGKAMEPMIFLSQTSDFTIFVLEGHHRLTAILLIPGNQESVVYVGSTQSLSSWKFY